MARRGFPSLSLSSGLALVLVLVLQVLEAAAGAVRLAWDRNTEPDLAGYVLVYGTASGFYTSSIQVGAEATSHEVTDLAAGTYYFALRAVNTAGAQSGYSNEVMATVASDPGSAAAPTISSFSPASGPAAGATSVTINGTGFQSGAVVRFGATLATVTGLTASRVVARTPAGSVGTVAISVVNPDGKGVELPNAFTYLDAAPRVTALSPSSGSSTGGTVVTLTGSAFSAQVSVSVDGASATVISVTATSLVVRMPAHAPGAASITVTNPDSQSHVVTGFTYVAAAPAITAVTPSRGLPAGGNTIVIAGTSFVGASVTFDGSPVVVTTATSTSLAVVAPAHASGAVTIVVRNADGQSATLVDGYVYDENAPVISAVSPERGPAAGGTTIVMTGQRFETVSSVHVGGLPASVLVWSPSAISVEAPAHAAGAVDIVVTFTSGLTLFEPSAFTYDEGAPADTEYVRYFAEGASGGFFQTRFALANPHAQAVPVSVTFTDTQGTATEMQVTVPALGRLTIDEANRPRLASEAFATRFAASQPIGVERTMTWAAGGPAYGAHSEIGVAAPRTSWVLAEGATIAGFNTFYLLQNPTTTAAQVKVQYLLSNGTSLDKVHTVGPLSRTNIWVNKDDPALEAAEMSATITSLNDVPVVVERSMYRNNGSELFSAGHNSAAVDAPALRWFLAEGATGGTFDEFVLIANPNASPAQMKVSYLRAGQAPIVKTYTAAGLSRLTIWVDQEAPELAAAEVSIVVECLTATPVVVERSMWWRETPDGEWIESHNNRGATTTAARWIVADGEAGAEGDASTWVLVANTGATEQRVRFTLLTETGPGRSIEDVVSGNGRYTLSAAGSFPEATGTRFSILVEAIDAAAPLVVERASYSSTRSTTWAAGTNALAMALP